MTAPLDVLAIFAHPDDAELLAGGALIRSVDRGERVGILDLTQGEMGSKGTVETRKRESDAAAEIMGVALRRNAGFPDAGLDAGVASRLKLAALIRELQPEVIVTHWLEGRHPDHKIAARLVVESSYLAGLRKLDAPGAPFRPRKVVHASIFRDDTPNPTFIIDITSQVERKMRAIACYESQFAGVTSFGEVYPGGERPFMDQVKVHLAYWGFRIRTAFAEPYWTQETVEVDTLGSAGVSTF